MEIKLVLEKIGGERVKIRYKPKKLLLAGFSGRKRDEVIRHIEELISKGVKIEVADVPVFYHCPTYLATTDDVIEVPDDQTSGEVEYVILTTKDGIFITVGSDHTDRELERISVLKSKWVCAKVMSKKVWDYEEIKDHWDNIEIRSYICRNGEKELYQSGKLESLLNPEDLLKKTSWNHEEGWIIFSGTIATLKGLMFSQVFEVLLFDPILGRRIRHKYVLFQV